MVSESFRWFQMVLGFKFQVSDGFRKNKTLKTKTTFLKTIAITIAIAVSKGSGWKPVPISSRSVLIPSQRLRLEAYTLSNRGRSLRIADSQSAGWKPVPKHNLYSLLIAQVGYWLPASGE